MIIIKNRQKKIVIDTKKVYQDVQVVLNEIGYPDFDIFILFTTNETIKKYNAQYRKKNKPTDILSFPFYPELTPEQIIVAQEEEEKNLGDLIISAQYVEKAARELGISFYQRLQELLVHGICHLLGYDHIDDADYKIMDEKEQFLLGKLDNK